MKLTMFAKYHNIALEYITLKGKDKKYLNEYELLEKIETGSFGEVRKVLRYFKESEDSEEELTEYYAMKVYKK